MVMIVGTGVVMVRIVLVRIVLVRTGVVMVRIVLVRIVLVIVVVSRLGLVEVSGFVARYRLALVMLLVKVI